MKIAIGADHRGFAHKEYLKKQCTLPTKSIEWIDIGAFDDKRSDYPIFAKEVAKKILKEKVQRGILICGSGVGMAVTANRYKHIYAALVWNKEIARISRAHDNSNILVIPSDFVSKRLTVEMIDIWLRTKFLHGRYQKRIDMIDKI